MNSDDKAHRDLMISCDSLLGFLKMNKDLDFSEMRELIQIIANFIEDAKERKRENARTNSKKR